MLQVDLEAASSRSEFFVIGDVSSDVEGTRCCTLVYTGLLSVCSSRASEVGQSNSNCRQVFFGLQVDLEAASSRSEFFVIGYVSSDVEGTRCCTLVYTGLLSVCSSRASEVGQCNSNCRQVFFGSENV